MIVMFKYSQFGFKLMFEFNTILTFFLLPLVTL